VLNLTGLDFQRQFRTRLSSTLSRLAPHTRTGAFGISKPTYKNLLDAKTPYEDGRENYYEQYGPIDRAFIQKYELVHDLTLPEDVCDLLLYQNGGHLADHEALKIECLLGSISGLTIDISDQRWLFGMIPLHDWLDSRGDYDADDDCQLSPYREEHKRLVVIDGDGHHFIAMDFRESSECTGIVDVELECGYGVTKHASKFKDLFHYW